MKPITRLEVEARIAPASVHWPSTAIHWDELKKAVAEVRDLVLSVNEGCRKVEADPDLSAEGISRKRREIGANAVAELDAMKAVKVAEQAVGRALSLFEERMVDLPKAASTPSDIAMAQEVRSFVREQKSPIDFVMTNLSDPRVVGAVLHAPAFLAGLTDEAYNLVGHRARSTRHPEFVGQQKAAEDAREHLRSGVRTARKMVLARAGMPDSES